MNKKLRKRIILSAVCWGIIVLWGTGVAVAITATEPWFKNFNWEPYRGTTIRTFGLTGTSPEMDIPEIREFEKISGVKVKREAYAYAALYDKLLVEMMTGSPYLDVILTQPHVVGKKYYSAGYYEPLEPYAKNSALTMPTFDFNDYAGIKAVTYEENIMGLLHWVSMPAIFYRTDLFEEYGISVPQTFAEFIDAAKKLTLDTDNDGKIDIYGVTMRGLSALLPAQTWLHGYGGDFFDGQGNVAIDSPESIAGLTDYVNVLRQYGPLGTPGYNWPDVLKTFNDGQAAMSIMVIGRYAEMSDPEKSKVSDVFSVAPVPAGPSGRREAFNISWMWNIYSRSRNKDISWLFMQWMNRPEYALTQLKAGAGSAYIPAWEDPEFKKTADPDWLNTAIATMKFAQRSYVPPIIQGLEARGVIEDAITKGLEGGDMTSLLRTAAEQLAELVIPGEFE